VGGGFLDVAQRDPRVEGGGNERVAQRVRVDQLGDGCPARDPPDDASGAVPVEARPSLVVKIGPAQRSPTARSKARAVRAFAMVSIFANPSAPKAR
jgi:hypothetical protein